MSKWIMVPCKNDGCQLGLVLSDDNPDADDLCPVCKGSEVMPSKQTVILGLAIPGITNDVFTSRKHCQKYIDVYYNNWMD